uniref:Uncharacterized protein n=1 Tax=Rhizophora mucronata TaxID=61149 RepID=A0A2P2N7Z1_RHIMU
MQKKWRRVVFCQELEGLLSLLVSFVGQGKHNHILT